MGGDGHRPLIRRFTDEPVDDATLARCLEAATWAPSGANAQAWRFIVLRSPELRAVVAEAAAQALAVIEPVYGMTRPRRRRQPRRPQQPGHLRAARPRRGVHLGALRPARFPSASELLLGGSIFPAMQNFLLAARAQGLGACRPAGRPTAASRSCARPWACPTTGCSPATSWSAGPRGRHGPLRRQPLEKVVAFDRWEHPRHEQRRRQPEGPHMTVTVITGAGSGMGRACIERLRGTADTLIAVDLDPPAIDGTVGLASMWPTGPLQRRRRAGPRHGHFRALVHAAVSPRRSATRARVLDVDLLGTQHLLDAFEALVSAGLRRGVLLVVVGLIIAPFITPELEALLQDRSPAGFIERAIEAIGGDGGFAYALAKVGVIRAAAGLGAVGWARRPGQLARPRADRHADGPPGVRAAARDEATCSTQTPLGRPARLTRWPRWPRSSSLTTPGS